MRSGQIPLALLGLYILITGLYGQFTWPLPGSYNILYYDIFPFWGLFLLASAWALHSKLKLQFVGLFSLLVGAMAILYGFAAYNLGLSSVPIAVLGLYGLFGLAGIFGYPMTLMFDRAQEKLKHKWFGWKIIVWIFLIALVLASLLAIYIAASAVPVHLKSPP
jgi:putative membrane protein